ncbi:MAG: esterase-like activity of phytase family protein [Rubrimonas sp.]|uniref:esterase-like activity of phytase family protein n=1 Tax=Rubrimonas sp. TaxID=2036015 RepID=UPI002FDC8707
MASAPVAAAAPEAAPAPQARPLARAPAPRAPDPIAAYAQPATLDLPADARLRLLGAIVVAAEHPVWGGLSGVAVSPDGARAVFLSDRAALFRATLERRDGALTGLSALRAVPIRDASGATTPSGRRDPEALALRADGALAIAFETDNAIWLHPEIGAPGAPIPLSAQMAELPVNGGIEALAFDAEGGLWAMSETPANGGFALFHRAAGASDWRAETLALPGPHRPTGLDIGPDGAFYLTRRDFGFLRGFRTRIERLTRTEAGWRVEPLLALDASPRDNIEGIAVWRDEAGGLRLLVVADDNFNAVQRNLIAEFLVSP